MAFKTFLSQRVLEFELLNRNLIYSFINQNVTIAEIIRTKGLEKINLEDLVEELLPKGRSLVPTKVKEDLLGQIKVFLEND